MVRSNKSGPSSTGVVLYMLLTILGSVFFSNYFGPEINGAFSFLWLFSLIVVTFGEPRAPNDHGASYLGLFLGTFLFLVFMVLLITSILHYL